MRSLGFNLLFVGGYLAIALVTALFWNELAPYVGSVIVLLFNSMLLPINLGIRIWNTLMCLTSGKQACDFYLVVNKTFA